MSRWLVVGTNWDSGWYFRLAQSGYESAQSFAFFPLYPLVIGGLHRAINLFGHVHPSYIPLIGSIVSWLSASAALLLIARALRQTDSRSLKMFIPSRWAGMTFLILAPASYVFLSLHTEGLFLLLAVLALTTAERARRAMGACFQVGMWAGLAALTRNHGVIVAIVAAFVCAQSAGKPLRFTAFLTCGLTSAALFALYPIYQWTVFGDPLLFLKAQSAWTHAGSVYEYVASLWLGNPWQNSNVGSLLHLILFFGLVATTVRLWRENMRSGALLVGGYVVLMPMQGELVAIARFAAVLFPVWLAWGAWFEKWLESRPTGWQRRVAVTLVLGGLVVANWQFARNFALGRWAY